MRSNINYYINLKLLSFKKIEELELLELYSNMRLKRYIVVYSYLIRLILKELEKKRKIAYLSLFAKRLYNVRAPLNYVYQAIVKSLLDT